MATWVSNGSDSDIQSIHDDVGTVDGDIITVPAGSHNWATGVSLTKAIHVQGAGSGRVVAWSADSVSIGTGSKAFTVQAGASISDGTTVRIWETATDKSAYMLGTVTSLVGTTLTVDVTESNGSGSHRPWLIATEPLTIITHNASTTDLFDLTESTAGVVQVSGIYFTNGTGGGSFIRFSGGAEGARPCQAHDIWFHRTASGDCFRTLLNRGILYEISATAGEFASSNYLVIHNPYAGSIDDDVWGRALEWGALNDGTQALFVEDCDFHGWLGLIDAGDNAFTVFRHTKFNHAGINSHGRDSGAVGIRAFEYYDNTCYFANIGSDTLPNLYWLSFRGGTGVIMDNVMPDIASSEWSDQPEIFLQVLALGTTPFIGWSYDDGGVAEYPAPRQVGLGYVTGLAGTENGYYFGDSEPIYISGNTDENGTPWEPVVGLNGAGGDPLADDVSDYVQEDRDYIYSAKPGYTKYEYPHPLRTDQGGGPAPGGNGDLAISGTLTVGTLAIG